MPVRDADRRVSEPAGILPWLLRRLLAAVRSRPHDHPEVLVADVGGQRVAVRDGVVVEDGLLDLVFRGRAAEAFLPWQQPEMKGF